MEDVATAKQNPPQVPVDEITQEQVAAAWHKNDC
jgi:hypothetical protein